MSETLLQASSAKNVRGLTESVRELAYKSVTRFGEEEKPLFQTAVTVATELGHEIPYAPADLYGVELASGPSQGQQYIPGLAEYTPEDHVRGVTATIVDSPLTAFAKAALIKNAVDATDTTRPSLMQQFIDGAKPLSNKGISERAAKKAALEELKAIRLRSDVEGKAVAAQDLATISGILRQQWHPNRSKAVVAALGLGAAGLLAVIRAKQNQ